MNDPKPTIYDGDSMEVLALRAEIQALKLLVEKQRVYIAGVDRARVMEKHSLEMLKLQKEERRRREASLREALEGIIHHFELCPDCDNG
jgi:hypothetical protein